MNWFRMDFAQVIPAKMIVFFVLIHCFCTVLSVGATDIIRVSNAVTTVQSETDESDVYKSFLEDSGFVNLETRTRMRREANAGIPLVDSEIEEVLNSHNAFRRLEPASDMQYMVNI